MLQTFSQPHRRLDPDEPAQKLMRTVIACASVKAQMAGVKGDVVGSARWGAMPWEVAVLTGLMALFDNFVGLGFAENGEENVVVPRMHFARGKKLISPLDGARMLWHHIDNVPPAVDVATDAGGDVHAKAPEGLPIPHGMASFETTQAQALAHVATGGPDDEQRPPKRQRAQDDQQSEEEGEPWAAEPAPSSPVRAKGTIRWPSAEQWIWAQRLDRPDIIPARRGEVQT